jgi:hypothetical protein
MDLFPGLPQGLTVEAPYGTPASLAVRTLPWDIETLSFVREHRLHRPLASVCTCAGAETDHLGHLRSPRVGCREHSVWFQMLPLIPKQPLVGAR